MIRKLTLAVGFGAGYVLGAKAGKERYVQIEGKVRELLGHPAVQDLTNTVTATASTAADKAKATVNDKVGAVGEKVGSSSGASSASSASSASTATVPTPDIVVDLGPTTTAPATGLTGTGTAGTGGTTGTGTTAPTGTGTATPATVTATPVTGAATPATGAKGTPSPGPRGGRPSTGPVPGAAPSSTAPDGR